jgi:hypothetical protein
MFFTSSTDLASAIARQARNDVYQWCQHDKPSIHAYVGGMYDISVHGAFAIDRMRHIGAMPNNEFEVNFALDQFVGFCKPEHATLEQIADVRLRPRAVRRTNRSERSMTSKHLAHNSRAGTSRQALQDDPELLVIRPAPTPPSLNKLQPFNLSTVLMAVHKHCYTSLKPTKQGDPGRREAASPQQRNYTARIISPHPDAPNVRRKPAPLCQLANQRRVARRSCTCLAPTSFAPSSRPSEQRCG